MKTDSFDISTLPAPESFLSSIQTLQQQLPHILDDFKKYYVFYNKNPDDTEYNQMFSNVKSNLNNINSQLFTVSNGVESNTNKITKNLLLLNKQIQEVKNKNNELKKKLGILEQKNNSSDELIHDYKEMYNKSYLRNWGLALSIGFSWFLLTKIFRKQQMMPIKNVA